MPSIVSFIMPAYKAAYLRKAIGSVLAQESGFWELVIIDDCSPEHLDEIVAEFRDDRIRYVRNERNIGGNDLVAQWNHCLKYATGEWVALAADDDIYYPGFCGEVLSLADKYQKVNLIRSRVELIDESGNHVWNDNMLPEHQNCYEFLQDYLTGRTLTCVGNYAFRTSVLRDVGGFVNFPCGFCSDIATPIQLAANGVANTSELLFGFRQSTVHLSGDKTRLKDKLEAFSQFYRWLDAFEYEKPVSSEDIANYALKNTDYLHDKYIYDCFNHVVKYVKLKELPSYLKLCRDADCLEKSIMVARWLKAVMFQV